MERTLLVCTARPSRRRALPLACAETVAVLAPFGAEAKSGGPLAEEPGIFWVEIDEAGDHAIAARAARLGYAERIERVVLGRGAPGSSRTWKKRPFELELIWEDSPEEHRESAPDRRLFHLKNEAGEVRAVPGYRGSSGRGERRALPVADARLLVNLTRVDAEQVLLDPFAGAGGIVFEAVRTGAVVWSVDVDPVLEPGLAYFGAEHTVGSAAELPFADGSVHGVATEPPFDETSDTDVIDALFEMHRVLVPEGRAALMIAERQKRLVVDAATLGAGYTVEVSHSVDRKGTPVAVLVLVKEP